MLGSAVRVLGFGRRKSRVSPAFRAFRAATRTPKAARAKRASAARRRTRKRTPRSPEKGEKTAGRRRRRSRFRNGGADDGVFLRFRGARAIDWGGRRDFGEIARRAADQNWGRRSPKMYVYLVRGPSVLGRLLRRKGDRGFSPPLFFWGIDFFFADDLFFCQF